MNINFMVNQEALAAYQREVAKQKAVADALPVLLAEIGTIDVQVNPNEAQAAAQRLYDLLAEVCQTPHALEPAYLLRQIGRAAGSIQEFANMELTRRAQAEKARQEAAKRQAEADAKERQEADRLRALLAKHPAPVA